MAAYRLEPAKTGRSTCRLCGKLIDAGTMRFGSDDPGRGSRWFHLECAPKGSPRAFAPFAAQAKAASVAAVTPVTPKPPDHERNEGLEAMLIAEPRSKEAAQVYADWLTERGDPWGAVIRAALANDSKRTRTLMKEHGASLMGAMSPRWFAWNRGLIVEASIEARTADLLVERYAELRALRTAAFVRELKLLAIPNDALMKAVSENPPRALEGLFTWLGPGLSALKVPHLRSLTLFLTRPVRDELDELFGSTGLEGLARFTVFGSHHRDREISAESITRLTEWPVLAWLREVHLLQGSLSDAGAARLIELADRFRHLKRMTVDGWPERLRARAQERFGALLGPSR